jgi:hypothetical protein
MPICNRVRPSAPSGSAGSRRRTLNKARLGEGWAHAALEQYDAALVVEAARYGDPLDLAVQESTSPCRTR